MSLFSLIIDTLKKEKSAIFLYTLNTFTVMLYYYFLLDKEFNIYPIVLTSTFLLCYLAYKLLVYRRLYISLNEGKISPKYKIKRGYIFENVINVLNDVHNYYLSKIYSIEAKYEERDKVLEEWIHNMKTSVSVIELASEKGKKQNGGQIIQDISEENSKLQENLEGALNLFRISDFTRDYVPEKVGLVEIVNDAINSQKRNFIYAGVFPKVKINSEEYIYTDKKWGSYIIKQVITNAIKYSYKGKSVYFYCEKNEKFTVLHIKDQGIGIKKEEQGRVFDAFYTGSNGRKSSSSSGIGLYMCKTICDMINSKITIESEEGKGSNVSIYYLTAM